MRSRRLLIATVAVLGLVATGCGSDDDGASIEPGSGDVAAEDGGSDAAGGGAAGACLAGAEDCQDTGGDMGSDAPPALGMCAADAPDCEDLVVSDPDAPVVDAPLPTDGVGDPAGPSPREVEPTDGLVDLRPVGWESVDVVDDRVVTVRWWSGVEPCNSLHGVEVDYAEDAVTLTVVEGGTGQDVACIEIAEFKSTTIELDEPLGARSIVDGAKG